MLLQKGQYQKKDVSIRLSELEIKAIYEMIKSYHERFLKKFGVKLPRQNCKKPI